MNQVIRSHQERQLYRSLPSIPEALANSSKVRQRDQANRKRLIDLQQFITAVTNWQRERPPLHETDKDIQLLTLLFLGEIEEIAEHREQEGLVGYDFKSETGEVIDAGFFLAAFSSILYSNGQSIDHKEALSRANGQANGSHALELLREVGGNIQEKTLTKDLQYLWTLWISYIIHMKYPVNPNQVLENYTFPKNNGNYIKEFLEANPIFEAAHGRPMNREESLEYFKHYRKATRLLRDLVIQHVDPTVEHTGLRPEHYMPYAVFIYSFETSGMLSLLEAEFCTNYNVPKRPSILRLNTRLSN